jgi:hypothetical protein
MGLEVSVERATGRIQVERVVCAQDCGLIVSPDGVRSQVEGSILQTLSRAYMNGGLSSHKLPTEAIAHPCFFRSAMSAIGNRGHSTGFTSVANDPLRTGRVRRSSRNKFDFARGGWVDEI